MPFEKLPNFLKPSVDFSKKTMTIDDVLEKNKRKKNCCYNFFEEDRADSPPKSDEKIAYDWIPKMLKITEK